MESQCAVWQRTCSTGTTRKAVLNLPSSGINVGEIITSTRQFFGRVPLRDNVLLMLSNLLLLVLSTFDPSVALFTRLYSHSGTATLNGQCSVGKVQSGGSSNPQLTLLLLPLKSQLAIPLSVFFFSATAAAGSFCTLHTFI